MNYTHKSEYNITYKYSTYPNLRIVHQTCGSSEKKNSGPSTGTSEGQALIDGPILVDVGAVAMGQVVPSHGLRNSAGNHGAMMAPIFAN